MWTPGLNVARSGEAEILPLVTHPATKPRGSGPHWAPSAFSPSLKPVVSSMSGEELKVAENILLESCASLYLPPRHMSHPRHVSTQIPDTRLWNRPRTPGPRRPPQPGLLCTLVKVAGSFLCSVAHGLPTLCSSQHPIRAYLGVALKISPCPCCCGRKSTQSRKAAAPSRHLPELP